MYAVAVVHLQKAQPIVAGLSFVAGSTCQPANVIKNTLLPGGRGHGSANLSTIYCANTFFVHRGEHHPSESTFRLNWARTYAEPIHVGWALPTLLLVVVFK